MNGDFFTESRHKLRLAIEDLCRWLEIGERATENNAYDADQVFARAGEVATALRDAVQEFWQDDDQGVAETEIRSIRACLDELSVLGIDRNAPLTSASPRSRLERIPTALRFKLQEHADQIRRDEEGTASRKRDMEELNRAIAGGVFIEFVRHNPGKGAWKTFPSYDANVKYDSIEGWKQSWTECEIVAYTQNLWVIGSTYRLIEVDIEPYTEYEPIEPARAAANLLAFTSGLDAEEIIWLKKLAGTAAQPEIDDKPAIVWNRELGELTVDGQLARRIARLKQAKNVTKILDAFQEDGWPVRIDSPFEADENGRSRLRETISQLNSQLSGVRFESDGTGEGVRFRLLPNPKSADAQPAADDSLPF